MRQGSLSLTVDELALLERAAADKTFHVRLVVTSCAYSCCGRGWRRRDGYEQEYVGWVDNLDLRVVAPDPDSITRFEPFKEGTLMLYSPGVGTVSYVIACATSDIALVEPAR